MKKITVVIVTYNSTKDIKDCIESINANNDLGTDLEIIVVDNQSADVALLKSILDSKFSNVRLIENHTNSGYGAGNNIGIQEASAPIILVMNPDVRLYSPIFKKALAYFEADEKLGLLGMCQYEALNRLGNSFLPIDNTFLNFIRYLWYKKRNKFNSKYLKISGACMFLRKAHFDEIGKFDNRIFMYGEEYDITKRFNLSPYVIKFTSQIGYIHPVHNRDFNKQSEDLAFQSFVYTRHKHNQSVKKEILQKILLLYLLKLASYLNADKKRISEFERRISYYQVSLRKYN